MPRDRIGLARFTFDALYFCGTPAETFRGEGLLTAVNDWYMGFIRSGWAVPLSFVIDVGTLLLRPGTGFRNRWRGANVRTDLVDLAERYYGTLQGLRAQPAFEHVAGVVQAAPVPARRDRAVKTFLRFLLAGLGELKNAYSFDTRDLKLLAARPAADGLHNVSFVAGGERKSGHFLVGDPAAVRGRHEFAALAELTEALCRHFATRRLDRTVSREELLMVELAAHSPAGITRADYRFLRELLGGPALPERDDPRPRPPRIEEEVPVDAFQTDGNVGGYIDVSRKRFSGNIAEVLPVELTLSRSRPALLNRLLNEGPLHYVRENFECIDRKLRLLFCFVVDSHPGMSDAPAGAHPAFGRGMTPSVRARALAALMIQDLARALPRQDIRVDVGLYLWSAGGEGRRARPGVRTEVDVFAWSPEEAADRFRFASGLVRQAPALFQTRPGEPDPDDPLDPDPVSFLVNRCRLRRYHGRHLVYLTSARTGEQSLPADDPGLNALPHTGDSVVVADCDPVRATVGVAYPRALPAAAGELRGGALGQLADLQLRQNFLRTVFLKAAGRTALPEAIDQPVDLSS